MVKKLSEGRGKILTKTWDNYEKQEVEIEDFLRIFSKFLQKKLDRVIFW
jgi:hypothetical protein